MNKTTASATAHALLVPVDEIIPVTSSKEQVDWRVARETKNKADVISVFMSKEYVNELRTGKNGYLRFISTDRIDELLELGKSDNYGRLYFRKEVKEDGSARIHCISRAEWLHTAPEDTLTLNVSSIKEAIKEGRPVLVDGDYYDFGYRHRLGIGGYLVGDSVALMALFEDAGEAGLQKWARLKGTG
ncbi:MAG: hypothetical protein KGH60_03360 [Candidatus Micrarchaeota archaeon]|nr:hypothetical protein [Candidatus Micrarchaeota archaeon]